MATKQPPRARLQAPVTPTFQVVKPTTLKKGNTYRVQGSGEDGWCILDGFTTPDPAGTRFILLSYLGGDMPGFQQRLPASQAKTLEERVPVIEP